MLLFRGTSHGAYKFTSPPTGDTLSIQRIKEIHARIPNTHLVMHGSSSVPQEWLKIINEFGGEINLQASQSKPYWPARVVPPKGAPNVLLIMTDDQGYGVSGTFGGVVPTPAMDRIAQMGLRYTQFHSTALWSL